MKAGDHPRLVKVFRSRWLRSSLLTAGVPLLALGCTHEAAVTAQLSLPLLRPSSVVAQSNDAPTVVRAASDDDFIIPASALAADPVQSKVLPISLDTVLQMTGNQNTQIALAREKVNEAFAEKCVADKSLLPLVARRIKAESKTWQQQGELSKVTNETFLEAGNTYIDLLTARTGEIVARELEGYHNGVLKKARDLEKVEPGAKVQVESIQAQLNGIHQVSVRLHQRGSSASAKLVYLLGLGPNVELVPVESKLIALDLVDATPPVDELVSRALVNGPGIHEMEGLVSVAQCAVAKSSGRLLMSGDRQHVVESKLQQAQLAYQDLRSKLALGVQDSRDVILTGKEQLELLDSQIRHATQAYKLSNERLTQGIPGSSALEVLQTIQGLELAHLEYLATLNTYDKAQLRLMILLSAQGSGKAKLPQELPKMPENAK